MHPGVPQGVVHNRADGEMTRGCLGEFAPVRLLEIVDQRGEPLRGEPEALEEFGVGNIALGRHELCRGGHRIEGLQEPGGLTFETCPYRETPEPVGAVEVRHHVAVGPSFTAARVVPFIIAERLDDPDEAPALRNRWSRHLGAASLQHDHRIRAVAGCQLHGRRLPHGPRRGCREIPSGVGSGHPRAGRETDG